MIIRSMDTEPARRADEQEQIVSGAIRTLNSEILIVLGDNIRFCETA